jgi:fucose 4-O-acetylase-like acetyltransferase
MIAGHSELLSILHIGQYVGGFYMPMFFVASGYFLNVQKYTCKEFIRKRCKTLLLPYIVWALFHLFLWMLMWSVHMPLEITVKEAFWGVLWENNVYFPIAGALWFLTCLFIVEVVSFVIIKFTNALLCLVIVLLLMVLGLYGNLFLPWSADSALVAVAFYCFGYCLRQRCSHAWKWLIDRNVFVKVLGLMFANVMYILLIYMNGENNIRACSYGKYPIVYVVCAVLGTMIWWLIAHMLTSSEKEICKSCVKGLSYIGRYSLLYVCLNQLPVAILNRIMPDNAVVVALETIIIIAGLTVLNRIILHSRFKFLIGR